MSMEFKENPISEMTEPETVKEKGPASQKKKSYPQKRTMNLYYRPDRTTKPATIALYVFFVLVCLLGLSKILIYDPWVETSQAQQTLAAAEDELSGAIQELADYNMVQERYNRYSATDEEESIVDRMEVLNLLETVVGTTADLDKISISGSTVQLQFSGVSLNQTARIVKALETSPIVAGTVVNTASTTKEEAYSDDDGSHIRVNVLIYLQREVAE